MKRNEAYNEKLMFEIAQENKRLTEPLTKALKEVNLLRHELANYEKACGRWLIAPLRKPPKILCTP